MTGEEANRLVQGEKSFLQTPDRHREVRSSAAICAVLFGINNSCSDYLFRHVLETIFRLPGREGERRDG
jgi:hypothetical protein